MNATPKLDESSCWEFFRDNRSTFLPGFGERDQNCAYETVLVLYNIWATNRGWHQSPPTSVPLLGAKTTFTRTCSCGSAFADESRWEPGLVLPVGGTSTSLENLLQGALTSSVGEPSVCENCNKLSARSEVLRIDDSAEYVFFFLSRFTSDGRKLTTETSFSPEITFHNKRYGLRAIVVHQGSSINDGHYFSYVKFRANGFWWRCEGKPGLPQETFFATKDNSPLTEEPSLLLYKKL